MKSRVSGTSTRVRYRVVSNPFGPIGVAASSSKKASEAQAALEREAAVRDKAEAKAGKQLERVQLQMSDWVRPLVMNANTFTQSFHQVAFELDLDAYLQLYSIEFVTQPDTPYIEIWHGGSLATFAALGKNPLVKIPPEDIAMLGADPAKR